MRNKCSEADNVVYDVANRETFEALPKWFSEIDTYVSTTVKMIVGNEVDKVRGIFSADTLAVIIYPIIHLPILIPGKLRPPRVPLLPLARVPSLLRHLQRQLSGYARYSKSL
jgi:hypothetical protein